MAEPPQRCGLPAALGIIVGVFVLVGAAVGLVWPHLVARPLMTRTQQIGLQAISDVEASKLIAMDGWFALLGMGACLVVGAVLTIAFQRFGVWTVLAQLAGAGLAAVVALVVGTGTANGEVIVAWHPHVPTDTAFRAPVVLHTFGVLALWPFAAILPVLPLLLLLWNRIGDDGRPKRADDGQIVGGDRATTDPTTAVHNDPQPSQQNCDGIR